MRRSLILGLVVAGLLFGAFLPPTWQVRIVSGRVVDKAGAPLADSAVRIKATGFATSSDSSGRFTISGFPSAFRVRVTAWRDGFYVGGADALPWSSDTDIVLARYPTVDNPHYAWMPAAVEDRSAIADWFIRQGLGLAALVSFDRVFLPLAERLTLGCRDCHGSTIHSQWVTSSHSQGARNPRFRTMYNGTDMSGNKSPVTPRGRSREYGSYPLRPDPEQPYYGPGYKLDFPDTAGNCAACHLPGAAVDQPYGTDPGQPQGVNTSGTHCDFCHKIVSVKLDRATGRPYQNMPGVLSIEFRRPPPDQQLFFGPYDDVDVGPDTYLPLTKQSEICAPCHSASFWDVPIYQSFDEWKASPYARDGKTCQSCHMEPDGVTTNFAPGRGGLERAPDSIPSHGFPGASDQALLQDAVAMDLDGWTEEGRIGVSVTLTNDGVGHHIPTGSPLRQLILLVRAKRADGAELDQLDGPTIPVWGGVGDPDQGYFAGRPGTAYAKILQEMWTGVSPSGAYWNPTRLIADNRIPAMASDTSAYGFIAPERGQVTVEATLLLRRAFIELMDQKGWDAPDLVMAHRSMVLGRQR